jgi:hypothetical protein
VQVRSYGLPRNLDGAETGGRVGGTYGREKRALGHHGSLYWVDTHPETPQRLLQ